MDISPQDIGVEINVTFRCQSCGKHNHLPALQNVSDADGRRLVCAHCGTFFEVSGRTVFLSEDEDAEVTPFTTVLGHDAAESWIDFVAAFQDINWGIFELPDGKQIVIGNPPTNL